jgi:archaellum component FlaC
MTKFKNEVLSTSESKISEALVNMNEKIITVKAEALKLEDIHLEKVKTLDQSVVQLQEENSNLRNESCIFQSKNNCLQIDYNDIKNELNVLAKKEANQQDIIEQLRAEVNTLVKTEPELQIAFDSIKAHHESILEKGRLEILKLKEQIVKNEGIFERTYAKLVSYKLK